MVCHVSECDHRVSDFDLLSPGHDQGLVVSSPPRLLCRVVTYGNERVSRTWRDKELMNSFWRLYLTDGLGVYLTAGGQRMEYQPDSLLMIPGWCPFYFFPDERIGHAYVHFDIPVLTSETVRAYFPQPFYISNPALVSQFRMMARQMMESSPALLVGSQAAALTELAMVEAIALLRTEQQEALLQTGVAQKRLAPAIEYIDAHLAEPIQLADLSHLLGVGPARTIRLFKHILGQTPVQFILERRIMRVSEMLMSSDDDLDEIAHRSGLPNRRYLSRVFKARTGLTPSDFRGLMFRGG